MRHQKQLPFYCVYCNKEFDTVFQEMIHECEAKKDLKKKLREANHATGALFAASEVTK